MARIAPKYTHVAVNGSAVSIQSGDSMTVLGIIVESAGTQGTVLVHQSDGTTLIMPLSAVAGGTTVMNIPFLAHTGLTITTDANVRCTVLHTPAS